MPKQKAEPAVITENTLLQYANVPVYLAAQYIGCSTTTLYYALQDGRAPFGFASCHENSDGKTVWAYNISARMLIAYKDGTLPFMGLRELTKLLTSELEHLLGGDMLPKMILRGLMQTMNRLETSQPQEDTVVPL